MTLSVQDQLLHPHAAAAGEDEQQPLLKYNPLRRPVEQQREDFLFLKMPVWTAVATCISCLGGFLFGFDLGVVGGLFIAPSFQSHFGIDPNDKLREADINGNIVAVLQIGCLAGSLIATTTADKFGRKPSILASSVVFTLGGTLQIIGTDLVMLYAGRLIAGLGVGALSMLVPVYVAEIAHQRHRGLLGGLWQFFISAGLALSYWTNYVVQRSLDAQDDYLWRIPLIVQTVPGAIMFLGMLPLFETPRSLCARGKCKQARKVIAKIRGWHIRDVRVEEELELIVSGLQQQSVRPEDAGGAHPSCFSSWRLVFARQNRKKLFFGVALQMFQQMTGTNVINYYSPIIFRSIGLSSNTSELLATGVYGFVKMAVVLVGFSCLVDSFGRRPLLVGGGVMMSVCMISVSICVGTREPAASSTTVSEAIPASAYAGIVSMYAFAVFFALSWGPLPWIYCSEIFPTWMRAKSTALTTAVNWTFNAIVGKFSPIMLAATPLGTYIFFGCWCLVMSIFCFFFLPETKGKALEEIDELFTKNRITVGKSIQSEEAPSDNACVSQSATRQ